ncbi:hypothetical protein, partial [Enterobacter cloacae]|uniref:hypothetical protein n=1 Tax=Enterobacter cloacae TaxID=550 RepID=UPI001CA53733
SGRAFALNECSNIKSVKKPVFIHTINFSQKPVTSFSLPLLNFVFSFNDFHPFILLNTRPIFTLETISSFSLTLLKSFAPICGTGCNFAPFRGAPFI